MERLALERPVTPLSGSHSERRFADAARNHNPGDRRHQPHGRHARWRWGRGSQRAVTTPSGSAPAASPRRVGGLGLGGLFGLVFILAGAGFTYQTIATEQDKAVYPPPGQLVDVGGHRLHIQCVGAGSPTVVTESGLGGTSLDWSLVQPSVAQTTRICTYDRAGFGWSEPGPSPFGRAGNWPEAGCKSCPQDGAASVGKRTLQQACCRALTVRPPIRPADDS